MLTNKTVDPNAGFWKKVLKCRTV